mgnify:CR=1 FL=1
MWHNDPHAFNRCFTRYGGAALAEVYVTNGIALSSFKRLKTGPLLNLKLSNGSMFYSQIELINEEGLERSCRILNCTWTFKGCV